METSNAELWFSINKPIFKKCVRIFWASALALIKWHRRYLPRFIDEICSWRQMTSGHVNVTFVDVNVIVCEINWTQNLCQSISLTKLEIETYLNQIYKKAERKRVLKMPKSVTYFTWHARDRDPHRQKYWTPNFLGFFGFVKTIKLLITQKKLRHEHKITPRAWCAQSKIVCFINCTKKYIIYKVDTAY